MATTKNSNNEIIAITRKNQGNISLNDNPEQISKKWQ
jgi:hypothetical protein